MAKIMIVDDAKIMRINLAKILIDLGHEVVAQAASGFEAIELYKKYNPELVTMDITMPAENGIKDGIEAVKQIQSINKESKIIMITSHGEEEKVIRAIRAGAKNYMLKPISIKKVKDVLAKVLNKV